MRSIKFSTLRPALGPWDKLRPPRFRVGNGFTTFRAYDVQKATWYQSGLGKLHDVQLDGVSIGQAELVGIRYAWSHELSLEFIQGDTYHHYTRSDWDDLMESLYHTSEVFGIVLLFSIRLVAVDYQHTMTSLYEAKAEVTL